MQNLSQLPSLTSARISEFTGPQEICERLIELGLTTGTEVRLISRMPFGGPLLIQVKNGLMALRRMEAECVRVTLNP